MWGRFEFQGPVSTIIDTVLLIHWNVLTHTLFPDYDHISNTSVKGPLYKSGKSIISSGTAKPQPQLICSTSHLHYATDSALPRIRAKYWEAFTWFVT